MADLLKDVYSKKFIVGLGKRIQRYAPNFNLREFNKNVFAPEWETLELKQRMRRVSQAMGSGLPRKFPVASRVLVETCKSYPRGGFELMIFPDFIEVYGGQYWKESIWALENMTALASGEFAVRQLLLQDSKKMMKIMNSWAESSNYHVRRLASEGCRPRLPWAVALPRFKKDPSEVLKLLAKLKSDRELYVRRSVANNLNDIAKDNPKAVLGTVREWCQEDTPEMKWLVRHGLRTLEKMGDPQALEILGYSPKIKIENIEFELTPKKIHLGQNIQLKLGLKATGKSPQPIVIDYVIFHQKASGLATPKVFKWSRRVLKVDEEFLLSKRHWVREISTRKYYSGVHKVQIQVNGNVVKESQFELEV